MRRASSTSGWTRSSVRLIRPLLVPALAALVLASAAYGSRTALGPVVKNTKGEIEAIAIDGSTVAYDVAAHGSVCNKVFSWNVNSGGGAVLSGADTCGADSTSTGGGVVEIAAAARRFAWIANLGGNTQSVDYLYSSSLPRPKEKRLAVAERYGDVDAGLDGDWTGYLVGDGDLLAVNRWSSKGEDYHDEKLQLITPSGLKTIAKGPGSWPALDADLGRIAVQATSKKIVLYSSSGRILRAFQTPSIDDAALRKDYLVVHAARKLEVYNTKTGKRVKSLPMPKGARGIDLHSGVAVYVVGKRVRAILLDTGKDVVIATVNTELVGVAIDAAGVVYAWNEFKGVDDVGNIAFLSLKKLRAKF